MDTAQSKAKRKSSTVKDAQQVIKYWQNKNGRHDVDYDAVRRFAKENGLLPVRIVTEDEQIDALLHRAVKNEKWENLKGHKIRVYGIPRLFIDGELLTLPPVDMRYARPDVAKAVLDANYEGAVNDVRRVVIEWESYNDNNPFQATLPGYEWDLRGVAEEALITGVYDDSFDEGDLDDHGDE